MWLVIECSQATKFLKIRTATGTFNGCKDIGGYKGFPTIDKKKNEALQCKHNKMGDNRRQTGTS